MQLAARPPLARMRAIDGALRADDRPSARTLAKRLEVHPHAIRRDITFLRDRLQARWSSTPGATVTTKGLPHREEGTCR